MPDEFKVSLSAEIDEASLENVKNQIDAFGKDKLKINIDGSGAKDAERNVKAVGNALKSASGSAKSFGSILKNAFGFGSAAAVAVQSIRMIRQAAKEAVNSIKEIDKSITDLRIVSNESYQTVSNWMKSYNEMAQSLGKTTTQIADSATTWMRQGKTTAETNTLIKDSAMLAENGMIDTASAAQYLTTTMKGYKVSVEDAITIVDKLSKLDSSAAVTAGDLAEGMSNVAQMANDVGVSMDTLLGQLSATGEVVGDVGKVGTALKTIYSRMGDIKAGKLELVDEDGTTELLSDTEITLKNVGIDLRKNLTEFNSYEDVLSNLADKWDTLNSVQQAALSKAFAGTRQQNIFRTLMSNYDNVRKYADLSANSAGVAEEKFSAYLDSIDAKTNTLKASFESLATNTFSGESFKGIIEATTALVTFIDKTNLLKGTLAGLIVAGTVKGFTTLVSCITSASMKLNEFNAALQLLKAGNIGEAQISQLAVLTSNLSKSQLQAVLSSKALSAEQRVAILTSQGMSKVEAEAALSAMGLAAAEGTATGTTNTLSGAFKGLWATLKANPLVLVATAVTAAVMAISALNHASENAMQQAEEQAAKSKEIADNAKQEAENISELISKYKELATADEIDSSTRTEIKNIQNEITSLVGSQADNLDLVNGKLDEELEKLKIISNQQLTDDIATFRDAYNDARKETQTKSTLHEGFWLDNIFGGNKYLIDYQLLPSDEGLKDSVNNIIKDVIEDKYGDVWNGYGSLNFDFSKINENDYKSRIEAISEILTKLQNLDGYDTDNEMFSKLTKFRDELQETYNKQIEQANNLINGLIIDYDNSNRNDVDSLDDYITYRNQIIDKIKSDSSISEMITEGVFDEESIEKSVDSYLGTLDDFSTYYNQWKSKFAADTDDTVTNPIDKTLTKLKDKVKAVKDLFSEQTLDKKLGNLSGGVPNDVVTSMTKTAEQDIEDFNAWVDSLNDNGKEILYKVAVQSDDTTLWTLTRWQEEFNKVKTGADEAENSLQQFYDIMNNTDDGNLSDTIEGYKDAITSLQDAFTKIDMGTLTDDDKVNLAMGFPELAPYINDTNALKNAIRDLIDTTNSSVDSTIEDLIESMGLEGTAAADALRNLKDKIADIANADGFDFDIDAEIEKFSNLYSAMKESVAATGLTSNAMKNVNAMFSELEGYDPSKLFERTENGIHLNTKALRELQTQYEKQEKGKIDKRLKSLQNDYDDLTEKIEKTSSVSEKAQLLVERDGLADKISDVADLATQYDGLTSAYNKWIQSQSNGDERDLYEGIIGGKETIDGLIERGWSGSDEVRTYIDLLSSADLSTASVEEVMEAYDNLGKTIGNSGYSLWDFMTVDDNGNSTTDGIFNFFDTVKSELGETYAYIDDMGNYHFDFGNGKDEEVAKKFGMDVEYLQSILRAANDAGFEINLDSAYSSLKALNSSADTALESLKTLEREGKIKFDVPDFDFDTSNIKDVETQIEDAQNLLDHFKNTDGTVNTKLEGAEEAETLLVALITRKQELNQPAIMSVDTSNATTDIEDAIDLLKTYQTNYNDIEIETAVGADTTEAQTNIQNVLTKIDDLPDEVKTSLGLDDTKFQTALTTLTSTEVDVKAGVNLDEKALATVQSTISAISPEVMVKAGLDSSLIDGYDPAEKESTVKYKVDDSSVKSYTAPKKTGTVTYNAYMNSWTAPTKYGTVIYKAKTSDAADANGTAYARGTTGKAFKHGDWSTKDSGTALGGELGQELVRE